MIRFLFLLDSFGLTNGNICAIMRKNARNVLL